jgi:hypothetical protein
MSNSIKLLLFKEQSKTKAGNFSAPAYMPPRVPFLSWKEGYIVKSTAGEEWTIKSIQSKEGTVMKHEDCEVTLVNVAGETRTIKSKSLRSGYEYESSGDVKEPEAPQPVEVVRDDCVPIIVNIEGIREFYPRKAGEGTRVLMNDKTAYIVADAFAAVSAKYVQAGGKIV